MHEIEADAFQLAGDTDIAERQARLRHRERRAGRRLGNLALDALDLLAEHQLDDPIG